MTLTRYFGGNLVDRFGRDVIRRRAALIGVIGILIIIFGPTLFGSIALYFAWVASALWGIGVALAFPLFLSAAGEGEDSARSVSLVATCGYTAFLVGPPLLGFLGQAIWVAKHVRRISGLLAARCSTSRCAQTQKANIKAAEESAEPTRLPRRLFQFDSQTVG
jgi:MFS family permease